MTTQPLQGATRAPSNQPTPSVLAVEYVLQGGTLAGDVAKGQATLTAVVIGTPDGRQHVARSPQDPALRLLEGTHRIYGDALAARLVEMKHGISAPRSFDDAKAMLSLLEEGGLPGGWASTEEASERAGFTLDCVERLRRKLRERGLEFVYQDIELPVIQPTAAMIREGIGIDPVRLNHLTDQADRRVEESRQALQACVSRRVDPNSCDDVSRLLYEDLGLPVLKHTPTGGPSTDGGTLRRLAGLHPAVGFVQDFREAAALSRAARSLLQAINPTTGRVHASLDPLGASTGRFSCSAPNLQGLPHRVRQAVVARPGRALLEFDIAHAELRILASLSGDPELLRVFFEGRDPHRETAATLLGKRVEDVSGEERNRTGKVFNFAIVYGQTAHGLSEDLDIPTAQASEFIQRYFRRFRGVDRWIERARESTAQYGCSRTFYGRSRTIRSTFEQPDQNRCLRQGTNHVIQGTAADLLKAAIARLHRNLPAESSLLLTVHDSVLIEAPCDRVRDAVATVRPIMEAVPPGFPVPFRVAVKVGSTWGEMQPAE